jgi:membrane carboxypeptidase/penicillin-binding protein
VGFDKPQRTVAQGYGATMALPVWVEVMNAANEPRYPASVFREGGDPGPAVTLQQWTASAAEARGSNGRPPQVQAVNPADNPANAAPPKVEAVRGAEAPPRVEPVLKPFRP